MPEHAWSEVAAELSAKVDRTNALLEALLAIAEREHPSTPSIAIDSIESFLRDCTVADQDAKTPSSSLFWSYRDYCRDSNLPCVDLTGFTKALIDLGFKTFNSNNVRYKVGLRLAPVTV